MLTKSEAIVLHSIKYGESRLVVEMFTRQSGRVAFMVTLPKSQKQGVRKQLFQPLTMLDIEADLRATAQLQKLRNVRLLCPFVSIPFDAYKLSITLFLAEFLYQALRSETQNAPLFDYMADSLQWLDSQSAGFSNFHLVFLMRLSRFLGFYPNLENYSQGDYFDLRESEFVGTAPVHHDFLVPQEAEKLQLLMRMDYPTMHLFQLSHHDRNRMLDIALAYYRLHLPGFPELKSLSVLKELYA